MRFAGSLGRSFLDCDAANKFIMRHEPGEFAGTEAVRVTESGGSGGVTYSATGNLVQQEGTILLRVRNDDWDAGAATQYLVRLHEDSTMFVEILLDTSAAELKVRGRDGVVAAWEIVVDVSAYSNAAWYDIALAYKAPNPGKGAALYVNGSSVGTEGSPKIPDGVTGIHVGSDDAGANQWAGPIDELVIFDTKLDGTEIANLSNRTGGAANTTYYEYNDNGLASKVIPTTGSPTEFHYDARMQRFAVDWAGTLNYYLWDGMNQLEEKDASLSTVAEHTHGATPIEGIGSIIVTKRSSEYQYAHYDHRGSLFNLEDTGATNLVCEFNAFGEELRRTGSAVTRFGYQGTAWQRLNSGLYVSHTRPFRPGVGAFSQRDPLPIMFFVGQVGEYEASPVFSAVFGVGPGRRPRPVPPVGGTALPSWTLRIYRAVDGGGPLGVGAVAGTQGIAYGFPSVVGHVDPTGMADSTKFLSKLLDLCKALKRRCCDPKKTKPPCGRKGARWRRRKQKQQCCTEDNKCCTREKCEAEAKILQMAVDTGMSVINSTNPPGRYPGCGDSGVQNFWSDPWRMNWNGWNCADIQAEMLRQLTGAKNLLCFKYSAITVGGHKWTNIKFMCIPAKTVHMIDPWGDLNGWDDEDREEALRNLSRTGVLEPVGIGVQGPSPPRLEVD